MRWILPILISLLLLVAPTHAQSFATGLGVGVRVSKVEGIYLGARYRSVEILGSLGTLRWYENDESYPELRIGGQRRFRLWTRDRFRVHALARLVFGFNAGEKISIVDGSFPIISGTLAGGAGVELPLHKRTQSKGLVLHLDVTSGLHRTTVHLWPQFGVGLYYYFF